jgi:exonuclease III
MFFVFSYMSLLPSPAHAASCGDAETSIISCDAAKSGTEAAKDSANNPIIAVLTFVMQILTGAVGIAAVGALIYAGILYSAAGGEAGQVQKAKTLIKDTVIGIICYAGMILILNFVIPGGVFGQQSTTGSGTVPGSGNGGDGGGGGGTTPGTGGTKKTTTFTIATWNVLYVNGASDIKSGAKKIASSGAKLIGFQELNFPASRNAIKDGLINCSGCDYSGYFPGGSGESGWDARSTVSLVWNKNLFSKLDEGSVSVSGPDGPANTGSKWITWVKLKDKNTGVIFYFADTHFVAHVTNRDGQVIQNYSHHMNKLMDFVSGKKEPIFITGDFNIGYNYDRDHSYSYSPYRNLKKENIYSNWDYFNKSSGSIDYVWATKAANVKPLSTKQWATHLGSDHAPVTLTVKVTEQ